MKVHEVKMGKVLGFEGNMLDDGGRRLGKRNHRVSLRFL